MIVADDKRRDVFEAENFRLKRIIKNMYQGILGVSSSGNTITSKGFLPLNIFTLLDSDKPFSERIKNTLAGLGEFSDVSRIYIFENHESGNLFSNTFEWCNTGVSSQINNLRDLSYDDFPKWRSMLVEEGGIQASSIEEQLPEEVHEVLAQQGIQSILVYPLWVKGQHFGFIGFDECSFNREWLPHEAHFLQMAAMLISNAYQHRLVQAEIKNKHDEILKINKELANKEQFLKNLLSSAPIGIFLINNRIIEYVNEATELQTGYSSDELVGKPVNEFYFNKKENVSAIKAFYEEIHSKGIAEMEASMKSKSNDEIIVRVLGRTAPDDNGDNKYLLICENITQKKIADKELIKAKEKAVSADKLKSSFLANLSHEIRTPLNAIVGFTNLLKEDNISEEETLEYIDIVNKSSENLMDLINDIIDIAKIESGELNMVYEKCDISRMLQELYVLFQKRMALDKKMHLKFYLNLPENNNKPFLRCDVKRLRQIFINLLGNAFKFTQKGFIEFGYSFEETNIRFYVRDTGIGIKPDKQSLIFEPFRQADESTSKIYGGTGLGLSICKRLVIAHGGKIGLTSEPETGSEFYFAIPFNEPKVNDHKPVVISAEPKVTKPANYMWPNNLMLLVDATSTARLQMRKVLNRTKITLISARTQKSARELLIKRNDINVVLMDLDMPGVELKGFIMEMRQMGIKVPFIGQTSKLTDEQKNYFLLMGLEYVLDKTVDNDTLLHAVNDAINGMASNRQKVKSEIF